jgi:hypothetical protein
MFDPKRPTGPIPGENYTSDERNWPWHRPPEIIDLDDAVDRVVTDLTESDDGLRYMTLVESGVSIATVTDIIVTTGVGRGLWTPDFALLIAGPVARILTIMAKSYGIEYELGVDNEPPLETAVSVKYFTEQNQRSANEAIRAEAEEIKEQTPEEDAPRDGGFMAPAPEEEQLMMLGYGGDDTDEEEVPAQ